jgi:hypothetical protein
MIMRWLRGLLFVATMSAVSALLRSRFRATRADAHRSVWRWQTRGMGLNMTEDMRDAMRGRWVRLRAHDGTEVETPADSVNGVPPHARPDAGTAR